MSNVVFEGMAPDAEIQRGNLFSGMKFWFSHKVPQRSRFINDVRANGGEIVPLEKNADVKIVDHARKDIPPGTHSFTFIEQSLRNGVLEDLETHRVGAPEGRIRSVGSIVQPPKGTRNKYTSDDDRILWDWVHKNPQKGGGTDGNEIYKQLEAQHPQHPWQSWRDRWIKQLKGRSRPYSLPHNAPPTPPSDSQPGPEAPAVTRQSKNSEMKELKSDHAVNEPDLSSFGERETEALMRFGDSIIMIDPERKEEAWKKWAHSRVEPECHTHQEWQVFWEQHVRHRYLKWVARQKANSSKESPTTAGNRPEKISKRPSQISPSKSLSASQRKKSVPGGQETTIRHAEPSDHQILAPPPYSPRRNIDRLQEQSISQQIEKDNKLTHKTVSVNPGKIVKRKYTVLEEEVPSSSPPREVQSPRRRANDGAALLREIASTPDSSPVRSGKRPESPLLIDSNDENDEDSDVDYENGVDESPLGKQPSDTLSEPGHKSTSTQAILQDATQMIDLDIPPPDVGYDDESLFLREETVQLDLEVPPPEDGWDDGDLGTDATSESESIIDGTQNPQSTALETQAILRSKTPALDLGIADPEGGWDHIIPSSPPPLPSSPVVGSDSTDVETTIESWIQDYVEKGVDEEVVITALKYTSMDRHHAKEVLRSLLEEGQLPQDKRGIWTESDDDNLNSTDARNIERLERKHGKDNLDARLDFLNFVRS